MNSVQMIVSSIFSRRLRRTNLMINDHDHYSFSHPAPTSDFPPNTKLCPYLLPCLLAHILHPTRLPVPKPTMAPAYLKPCRKPETPYVLCTYVSIIRNAQLLQRHSVPYQVPGRNGERGEMGKKGIGFLNGRN